ncbi:MAG TPA: peptidoglycan-associated lipoprotein Pal [bacterium]|nr:peptidoglycan-associated lipoprotein Pal [bacterium]
MIRKRYGWLAMLCVLYVGMMGAGSCGKKALTAIGDAKTAVEQAREADAPQWASQQFQSAEDSLALAQQQYDKYQFKKSENTALLAETKAREALELAMKHKEDDEERLAREAEEAARLARSSIFDTDVGDTTVYDEAMAALHDVHFEFDSPGLSDAAQSILAINADWLAKHPAVKVEIEGHCDERGTDEYNLALGAKRAKAVYDAMVKLGIDESRMRTISYGESVPVDQGHTEEAWARNRRAHFAIIR